VSQWLNNRKDHGLAVFSKSSTFGAMIFALSSGKGFIFLLIHRATGEFVFCTFRIEKSLAGKTADMKPSASLKFTDEYPLDCLQKLALVRFLRKPLILQSGRI
jgi:hypothetical protein